MSAPGVTGGEQLKMFMTPNEIMGDYQVLDGDRKETNPSAGFNGPRETDAQVWTRKGVEAEKGYNFSDRYGTGGATSRPGGGGASLQESVNAEGVKNPVHLGVQFGSMGKREVVGGHHRIAAQANADPDRLMPVLHHQDFQTAVATGTPGKIKKRDNSHLNVPYDYT